MAQKGDLSRRPRTAGQRWLAIRCRPSRTAQLCEPQRRLCEEVSATVSTDADYYVAGKTPSDLPGVPKTLEGCRIPNVDYPARDTIGGYRGQPDRDNARSDQGRGFFADLIAVPGTRWTMSTR